MGPNAADGAALVAAAVQAAIRESAPRRTVAAVAAAVAGTVLAASKQVPATVHKERAQDAPSVAEVSDDPAELLDKLRSVRRAQRQRKKQKRRDAKQAALDSQRLSTTAAQHDPAESGTNASTAGQGAELGGTPAAVPAPVLEESPGPASPARLTGLALQQLPGSEADTALDGLSASSVGTMCAPASDASSAGMLRHGRRATARHAPYGGTFTGPGRQ